MAACETCWEDASRDVMVLGGSVVDRYRKRLLDAQHDHPERTLIDFGHNCSHCGHAAPHSLPCPGTIITGTSNRTQTTKPCPCVRNHHNQETK